MKNTYDETMHEECGIFGFSLTRDSALNSALAAYSGLFALQHRGQESCGIAWAREGGLHVRKGTGLLTEVFSADSLPAAGARMVAGHVRYAGETDASPENAQPFIMRHTNGSLCICFNGRLTNSKQLRSDAELRGYVFQTSSDAELIGASIVRERLNAPTLEDALIKAMQYMEGAYSIMLMSGRKLIAARDPHGFRPLCLGTLDGSSVFASESCALDAIGARLVRDVEPGEIVTAENGALTSRKCGIAAKTSLCIFEFIYTARPDSKIDGVWVDTARREAGRALARQSTTPADVVIPIPDSGLTAAMAFAEESGLPYDTGLVKNRYVGRTFIYPVQAQREQAVRMKLSALSPVLNGKRVIMVDDSIVRGTTFAHTINLVRSAGAREVHLKIASPPFLYPCYFGTNVSDTSDLAANNRSIEELRAMLGADSLQFLKIENLARVAAGLKCGYCDACFTGDYPSAVPKADSRMEDDLHDR